MKKNNLNTFRNGFSFKLGYYKRDMGGIVALSLSIIDIFIGVSKEVNKVEFIMAISILLILYVPGLVYFSVFKNKENID
ncbi:MAG: hypothetical protein H7Y18_17490 [Clostridiaceae bacterium]|nr:hypothetical protein [Clostridiaceae bacterium]